MNLALKNQNLEILQIPRSAGIYILFIFIRKKITLSVGFLGSIEFPKGYYLYVGSALNPGGLEARITRHLKKEKKIFWHIDYLLNNEHAEIIRVKWFLTENRLECYLVNLIFETSPLDLMKIKNFGSSDCNCKSHLLFSEENTLDKIIEFVDNVRLDI